MDENGPLISESVLPASSTSDDIVDAPTSYRSPSLSTPVEQDPPQHDVGYADLMDVSTSLIDMQPTKVDTITTNHRLPHNASALLELYFAFTHSWLPMTEKHSILRVMYSYPPSGLSREQSNSAEHAELWSIMALAATQLGDNDASSGDLGQIRQHADSLLPAGNAPYEVPHIRALLLRALDDFQRDQILSAWLRVGSVLLANIGQTARRCCHVQLAAFVIETALACRLRTVGHFTTDYIRRVGFVDEDGMDEWEPWSDPLNISSGHPVAKAPTKAFSTLNELVRFHLRMVDTKYAGDGLDCATISGLNDPVVSALLRNASTQQRRILPFDLTMAFCKNMEGKTLNWTSDARPDLNPTWTLPDANPADPQDVTSQSASERGHAFMTIPNDSSQTGLDLAQTGLGMLWPTFQSPVQLSNTLSGAKNASSDIFDELSTLERQESSHNPHFMHNLGFPDLDLAEFFGAGYLPTET
ncbi:hypothetical protein LTR09_008575 [Extremus antarcticus]|uniref:Xylanolytic transcriptional activator regulatory domain-containing protein n=1 Tax=Extremus antarcticus TaxID=702011 RepID=A0AAJ0DAM2_9PEZI|nr:hypothetical protein LTR09_008575 [Extremus antarcticus]